MRKNLLYLITGVLLFSGLKASAGYVDMVVTINREDTSAAVSYTVFAWKSETGTMFWDSEPISFAIGEASKTVTLLHVNQQDWWLNDYGDDYYRPCWIGLRDYEANDLWRYSVAPSFSTTDLTEYYSYWVIPKPPVYIFDPVTTYDTAPKVYYRESITNDSLGLLSTNSIAQATADAPNHVEVWPDRTRLAAAKITEHSRNITWHCILYDKERKPYRDPAGNILVFPVIPEWRKQSELYEVTP